MTKTACIEDGDNTEKKGKRSAVVVFTKEQEMEIYRRFEGQ